MSSIKDLCEHTPLGTREITLSEELTTIPDTLWSFKDSLEMLDLSNNKLSSLPDEFSSLKKLKILFLSNNQFTSFPKILRTLPELSIIGIRNNSISNIEEEVFPPKLRWLILTQNQLTQLPESIGTLNYLEKVALAGNQLSSLPDTMQQCKRLALLRICANAFEQFPDWLFHMPQLAWLALAGNPLCNTEAGPQTATISWESLSLHETLGKGASGVTYRASCHNVGGESIPIAVKLFKSHLTSDGYPDDEIACHVKVGIHDKVNSAIATVLNAPDSGKAIALRYYDTSYKALGLIPNFVTCSRDRYEPSTSYTGEQVLSILHDVAIAMTHIHAAKVSHGDLYAHNILSKSDGSSAVGDFGAATIFSSLCLKHQSLLSRYDVLAYGYLIEELLAKISEPFAPKQLEPLIKLKIACTQEEVGMRPDFFEIRDRFLTLHG